MYLEDLCCDAQQAAEKAIKAVLIKQDVKFPYIHDLAELLTIAEQTGIKIPKSMKMVQRTELERELAHNLSQIEPRISVKHYLVLGTMEKKIWREGLGSEAKPLAGMLEHVADFKGQFELQYEPGGWYPAPERPKRT